MALRVDYSGNVYVAEASNYYGRVSIFQPTGVNGSGVPVYGAGTASQKIVASGSTGPMGIEIDPNMNSAATVGIWVIDHLRFSAFRYQVTWPTFGVTTTQTISTSECLASPGVDSSGNLYISNYRGEGLLRYPAGSGTYDISIFQAPAGANGTQNKIGDIGFYDPDGVAVASLPGAGVTQIIAADGIRLHFWNMPSSGPPGLTNGQPRTVTREPASPMFSIPASARVSASWRLIPRAIIYGLSITPILPAWSYTPCPFPPSPRWKPRRFISSIPRSRYWGNRSRSAGAI